MLQVAELRNILEEATGETKKAFSKQTKYYWRDLAVNLAKKREDLLISFALDRWRLPGEKKYTKGINPK